MAALSQSLHSIWICKTCSALSSGLRSVLLLSAIFLRRPLGFDGSTRRLTLSIFPGVELAPPTGVLVKAMYSDLLLHPSPWVDMLFSIALVSGIPGPLRPKVLQTSGSWTMGKHSSNLTWPHSGLSRLIVPLLPLVAGGHVGMNAKASRGCSALLQGCQTQFLIIPAVSFFT